MARTTGLLVGGSTGGVIYKALESIDAGTIGGNVLVIVAEGGEKYLHTFYDDQWMAHRKLFDPAIEERLGRWLSQRVKAAAFVEA